MLSIIPMERHHWPQVAEIYQAGIETRTATFRDTLPTWQEFDEGHLAPARLVALLDGAVAGWAAVSPSLGRDFYWGVVEDSVYIHPDYTGKGVGKALVLALLEAADQAGYWSVEARIILENKASLALHRACGFREVGVRERLGRMAATGIWHDVVFMEWRSRANGVEPSSPLPR